MISPRSSTSLTKIIKMLFASLVFAVLLSGCTTLPAASKNPPTTSSYPPACPAGTYEYGGNNGVRSCLTQAEIDQRHAENEARDRAKLAEQKPQVDAALQRVVADKQAYKARLAAWLKANNVKGDMGTHVFRYFCATPGDQQSAANDLLDSWPVVVNSPDRGVFATGGVSEQTLKALQQECGSPRRIAEG